METNDGETTRYLYHQQKKPTMEYTNKIKKTIKSLEQISKSQGVDLNEEINSLEKKLTKIQPEKYSEWFYQAVRFRPNNL